MKRFVHAKNIVLWLAALFVIVTAMILLLSPLNAVLEGYVLGGDLQRVSFSHSYKLEIGKTVAINLSETEIKDMLHPQADMIAKISIDQNVILGPIIILLGGLAIVGLSFLKPSKLRGWGFILCIAIIITGLVFYIIYMDGAMKEVHKYFYKEYEYLDEYANIQKTTHWSYVDSHKVKIGTETYYLCNIKQGFELQGNGQVAVYLLLPALPLLIVGMALKVRKPKAANQVEAPVQEAPVEEAPTVEEAPEEAK